MLESHLKHCNIDGDGQSVQQEINSWNEAIGDGVEPAEQPDSQGAGSVAVMATATVGAVGPRLALSGDGERRQETPAPVAETLGNACSQMCGVSGQGCGRRPRCDVSKHALGLGVRYDKQECYRRPPGVPSYLQQG